MAAQAAAGAVTQLLGAQEVVVCAEVAPERTSADVWARCSLLVLGDDAGAEREETGMAADEKKPALTHRETPAQDATTEKRIEDAPTTATQSKRSENWSMLSALAASSANAPDGVSRGAHRGRNGAAQPPAAARPAPRSEARPAPSLALAKPSPQASSARSTRQPTAKQAPTIQQRPAAPAAPRKAAAPLFTGTVGNGRRHSSDEAVQQLPRPQAPTRPAIQEQARASTALEQPAPGRASENPFLRSPQGAEGTPRAAKVSVGSELSDALVAMSLDLPPAVRTQSLMYTYNMDLPQAFLAVDPFPPSSSDDDAQAARWRQKQRALADPPPRLVVWEVDELQPWEEPEPEPQGLRALLPGLLGGSRPREPRVNIKQRVSHILERDRNESLESSN